MSHFGRHLAGGAAAKRTPWPVLARSLRTRVISEDTSREAPQRRGRRGLSSRGASAHGSLGRHLAGGAAAKRTPWPVLARSLRTRVISEDTSREAPQRRGRRGLSSRGASAHGSSRKTPRGRRRSEEDAVACPRAEPPHTGHLGRHLAGGAAAKRTPWPVLARSLRTRVISEDTSREAPQRRGRRGLSSRGASAHGSSRKTPRGRRRSEEDAVACPRAEPPHTGHLGRHLAGGAAAKRTPWPVLARSLRTRVISEDTSREAPQQRGRRGLSSRGASAHGSSRKTPRGRRRSEKDAVACPRAEPPHTGHLGRHLAGGAAAKRTPWPVLARSLRTRVISEDTSREAPQRRGRRGLSSRGASAHGSSRKTPRGRRRSEEDAVACPRAEPPHTGHLGRHLAGGAAAKRTPWPVLARSLRTRVISEDTSREAPQRRGLRGLSSRGASGHESSRKTPRGRRRSEEDAVACPRAEPPHTGHLGRHLAGGAAAKRTPWPVLARSLRTRVISEDTSREAPQRRGLRGLSSRGASGHESSRKTPRGRRRSEEDAVACPRAEPPHTGHLGRHLAGGAAAKRTPWPVLARVSPTGLFITSS
ncbi:uncharacterized protein LOC134541816 [Bacillus rossius redtenbacheri]|uniref:uncharacterized protein LOC134541816 n=1 Tax=Bacillus rossius redtenbacheri TaxID=93214 RepID=UPI002FDEB788